MKINWFSNSFWAATGYGNQTKVFVPRLQRLGHEMSISAFYGLQGGVIRYNGIPVYPVCKHPYGQDVMTAHAVHAGAEMIISLLDIWVVQPQFLQLPWFPWFPIDHDPIPNKVLEIARQATKGIVMSKFGYEKAREAGLDVFYIPHGIDTNTFKQIDRREARTRLNLPQDIFIVGMVAANKGNPSRKAFFEQLMAFARFKEKHSDAFLFLHTEDGTRGGEVVNLIQLCQRLGFQPGRDVLFCDQYQYALGFPDEYMRDIYNAFDVLMNVSLGEGFGIPIVEAQACGCPVIVGDWTSMGELTFSGWKIPKGDAQAEYHDYFDAYQWRVNVGAVAERLERAYRVKDDPAIRAKARKGAVAYDADRIVEQFWTPVLAEIEANYLSKRSFEESIR